MRFSKRRRLLPLFLLSSSHLPSLLSLSLVSLKAVCLEERTRSPASFLHLSLFLRSLSSCLFRSFFYFASFCFRLSFLSNSVSGKGERGRFPCSFVFPVFLFASALSFVSAVCILDSLSVSLVCAPFLPAAIFLLFLFFREGEIFLTILPERACQQIGTCVEALRSNLVFCARRRPPYCVGDCYFAEGLKFLPLLLFCFLLSLLICMSLSRFSVESLLCTPLSFSSGSGAFRRVSSSSFRRWCRFNLESAFG